MFAASRGGRESLRVIALCRPWCLILADGCVVTLFDVVVVVYEFVVWGKDDGVRGG